MIRVSLELPTDCFNCCSLTFLLSVHREKKRSGPQSAERPRAGESEPDPLLMDSSGNMWNTHEGAYFSALLADVVLQEMFGEHQTSLRSRSEYVAEGTEEAGREKRLNKVYTELYITEGLRQEVHTQHEVMQMETTTKTNKLHGTAIKNPDIFKVFPDQHRSMRVVLTSGVAGAGKTFSVQKFTLDWAEGLENQDISAVVPLSFREMNLIRDEQHSLLTLIQRFHPTFQKIPADQLSVWKILFIFDGLDESRLSLDFNNSQVVSDVTQKSSINVLLTNLIQGRLLPSALVWITSRPAAANQIPPSCVDRLTEVRGFNDAQKEEYFRKRFTDEELSSRIISHIKGSMSLYIMCEVPVFCWITAVVMENLLTTEQRGELPTTLTDMYSHFLMENPQELTEADMEVLLKLGRLSFEHLEKGNIMFYQEDLEQCGLDVTEASLYSGVCTEIFRRECEIFQKPVYSFVHLSVQEFLAAVYMIHCYNKKVKDIEKFLKDCMENPSLDEFLNRVMEKSLAINNLKEINSKGVSPDRSINIYHCLMEMKDLSVYQEIQEFLKSENRSEKELSEIHCSALAYTLQMSDEVLDELDLDQYKTSNEGRRRLIPAVRNCRKFSSIYGSAVHFENLSVSRQGGSHLTEFTKFQLSSLLLNTFLSTFRLKECSLSEINCEALGSALKENPSNLTELDLSDNYSLHDSGFLLLCGFLESPDCRLQTLRSDSILNCRPEAGVLQHAPVALFRNRYVKRSGPNGPPQEQTRKEERLWLCRLSKTSCANLVSALKSNPSHLTELDLSFNNLQSSDVQQLQDLMKSPKSKLQTLRSVEGWSQSSCFQMFGPKVSLRAKMQSFL
uniref:NACHT domain-containing protein n=1 Tax=Oryzias latipes TaxID=8090 RepID=A0A3B3HFA6_ORYLA